jgi:hypothetical protein
MKRTVVAVAVLALLAVGTTGCGFVADGPFGWGYTASKTAVSTGSAKTGTKKGSACVTGFFGFISIGDASIGTAMKNGGIKEIFSVDKDNLSVFGTYTKQCTIVTGE